MLKRRKRTDQSLGQLASELLAARCVNRDDARCAAGGDRRAMERASDLEDKGGRPPSDRRNG